MIRKMLTLSGVVVIASGCGTVSKPATPAPMKPVVTIVHPEKRDINRTVGQPGFVEAYEQAALYAKVSGYIEKWNVDIGDIVKKDQVLATIFVPELVEEYRFKQATVQLDTVLVDQARKAADAAAGNLKATEAKVVQAKADVGKFQAEVDRWQSEVKRLTGLVQQNVVDKQVLGESTRQLKSNEASRDAANAMVLVTDALREASVADLAKAKVDVTAAEVRVTVAQADEKRLAALVGYLRLTAPFDGIITVRNANTGDFVANATGDQSANRESPGQSTSKGAPIYVVARLDKVRVFVDVPEVDAGFVGVGTPGEVRFESMGNMRVPSKVARTSWALNLRSRTLRTEIDLPNPSARYLPGMYVYGYVNIQRNGVMTIPSRCVARRGDSRVVFLYKDGKSQQLEVRASTSDGDWIEILAWNKGGNWVSAEATDQVILGNPDELSDGIDVELNKAADPS